MPWKARKSSQCPSSRPWGVFRTDTGKKVACHASQTSANKQVRALYANEAMAECGLCQGTGIRPSTLDKGQIEACECTAEKKNE